MHFRKNLKHIFVTSFLTLALIFGAVQFFQRDLSVPVTHFFVYREGNRVLDALFSYDFRPSPDIVIVNIDEATIDKYQSQTDLKMLTIPRSVYIAFIDKLESVGVKAIGFDIIFQNKDPEEEIFAEVLKKYDNIVIGATKGICIPKDTPPEVLEYLKESNPDFRVEVFCDTPYLGSEIDLNYKAQNPNFQAPKCVSDAKGPYQSCEGIPRSLYQDTPWGHLDIDGENRDRRRPAITLYSGSLLSKDKYILSLPLALYREEPEVIEGLASQKSILQPFFGPEKSYHEYSFGDFFEASKLDLIRSFGGKYVLVGYSGRAFQDRHTSPVTGELMYGVEFHAHMLDGLLQKRFLTEYTIADTPYIISLIIFTCFIIALYMLLPKVVSIFVMVAVSLTLIYASRYLYFHEALVIEILPLLLAGGVLSFPLTFIYRFFIVDREKNILAQAFSRYVDPEVVREIRERNTSIELGGESRVLSVLFSDIAGFTTIAEKTPVRELFLLMSSYLSRMTGILIAQGGTLDKYIGDAVMGFFGAPLSQADHARRACQTALDMRKALPEFNNELATRGIDPIDFRVGIASGEVYVGNIGSKDRFNYTVLGDAVNLASRLEATSKEYGTHIIVSERTYDLTKESFAYRKLDLITVKGKMEPVGIYELISSLEERDREASWYDEYARALDLYISGDYLEAGKIWESQMHIDPPSQTMALRCVDILRGDLVVEGGVYHMLKK